MNAMSWGLTEPSISTADCVAIGGHCWTGTGGMTSNGIYSEKQEHCQHCPATRTGLSREPWEWTYPDGQD